MIIIGKQKRKTKLLSEQESNIKQDDVELRSEIESLRGILLAKLGDVEEHDGSLELVSLHIYMFMMDLYAQ